MKRFLFRRRAQDADDTRKQLKESKERLKQTQKRWPEVERATHRLERLIEQALRGGPA